MIVFGCKCGIALKVRPERAGQRVTCRLCGKSSEVPARSERAAGGVGFPEINTARLIGVGASALMMAFIGLALVIMRAG